VEIRIFNPIRLSDPRSVLPPRLNTRTHEKFSYFSQQKTATIGDRNWQAYNFRLSKKYPGQSYRSVEAVVEGDVAKDFADYAERLWNDENLVKKPKLGNVTAAEIAAAENLLRRYRVKVVQELGRRQLLVDRLSTQLKSVSRVRFIHDVPSKKRTVPGMDHELAKLIEGANSSIDLVSPYIVLTKRYRAMIERAIERGVKVRILTPALEVSDAPIASAAFEQQVAKLRESGVEVYHHLGPDFLHAKMIVVDGKTAGVLTHNFDFLSEYLNYESGLLVDDPAFAKEVGDFVQYMMDHESRPYSKQKVKPMLYCMGYFMRLLAEKPPFRKLKY
jgi:putative cardiolipin synthase